MADDDHDRSSDPRGAHPVIVFEPFPCEPLLLSNIRDASSGWLLSGVVIAGLLFGAVTIATGTFGPLSLSDAVRDVAYVLRISDTEPTGAGSFPLSRDFVTWVVFGIMGLTLWLLHVQWRRMRSVLPDLYDSGAIDPEDANIADLNAITKRCNDVIDKWFSKLGLGLFFIAALITAAVMYSLATAGIFGILAPRGSSATMVRDVADAYYQGWWAGANNIPGLVMYWFLGTIGVYVIILQNLIGGVCIYLVARLRNIEFSVDPRDADGLGGWRPMRQVLVTVYVAIFMHGFGLSLLILVLGATLTGGVGILLLFWIVVAPTYVIAPLVVFGRAMSGGREKVVKAFLAELKTTETKRPQTAHERAMELQTVDRLRDIRGVPLYRPGFLVSMLAVQALPFVALGLEVWLSLSRAQ